MEVLTDQVSPILLTLKVSITDFRTMQKYASQAASSSVPIEMDDVPESEREYDPADERGSNINVPTSSLRPKASCSNGQSNLQIEFYMLKAP